jgi:hypothetical protein
MPIAMDVVAELNHASARLKQHLFAQPFEEDLIMGRGILLWMLGVPLPIILLLAMCSHR